MCASPPKERPIDFYERIRSYIEIVRKESGFTINDFRVARTDAEYYEGKLHGFWREIEMMFKKLNDKSIEFIAYCLLGMVCELSFCTTEQKLK